MSVAKIIEIVAVSAKSFDDAIQEGLTETARSLTGISGIEIINWTADVENNQIVRYKVTMHVAFKVEHNSSTNKE